MDTNFWIQDKRIYDPLSYTGYFLQDGQIHGPEGKTGLHVEGVRIHGPDGDTDYRIVGNRILGPTANLPWGASYPVSSPPIRRRPAFGRAAFFRRRARISVPIIPLGPMGSTTFARAKAGRKRQRGDANTSAGRACPPGMARGMAGRVFCVGPHIPRRL